MHIEPGPPRTPLPWAARLGHPAVRHSTRQWCALVGDEVVGGALLWEGPGDASVALELNGPRPEVAEALLRTVAASTQAKLRVTMDTADPVVGAEGLAALGFERIETLVQMERSLEGVERPNTPLRPRSFGDVSHPDRVELLARIRGCGPDEANGELRRMAAEAGAMLNLRAWAAVELEGALVGLVLPQPDAVSPREGSLATVGLVPEARGKGLGRGLHQMGLWALSRLGTRHYLDYTEEENGAMRAVFAANGCTQTGTAVGWRRPAEQPRDS